MFKSLTKIIPFKKPPIVKALSPIIPRRKKSEETYSKKSLFSTIIPFNPEMLRLEEVEQKHYIVQTPKIEYIVSADDVNDWTSLLERFNLMIGNLMKVLSNLRKQQHHSILYLKLTEREIERRHSLLHEKLLEKTQEVKEVQAKTELTDKEKIQKIKDYLTALGYASAGALVTDPGTITLSGNISQKAAQLAKKLVTDLGITDFQAAGIVGNLLREGFGKGIPDDIQDGTYSRESGPPPAYGTMGVGYGWAQWTNGGNNGPEDRLNKFIIRLGGGPGRQARAATDSDNYAYLLDDFRGRYANVLQSLKASTNVTQATEIILKQYERPANQSAAVVQSRAQYANTVLQEMRKAGGGIVIQELFGNNRIQFDTFQKTTLLSNFIVDRPTIFNMKDIGEPLVIIPLNRPIGRLVLQTIFRDAFRKLENRFSLKKLQNKMLSQSESKSDEFLKSSSSMPSKGVLGSTSPATPGTSEIGSRSPATPVTPSVNTPSQNLSMMSIEQLKGMLDPTVTGAANPNIFNAAKTAREAATMQGLSQEEIERQVLMATIAASKIQPHINTLMRPDAGKITNTVVPFPSKSQEEKLPDISPSLQSQDEKSRIDTNISQRTENIITGGSKKVIMVNETYIYTD